MYPEKIKAWLSRSMDALTDVCDEDEENEREINGNEEGRIHSMHSENENSHGKRKSTIPTFLKMNRNKNKKNKKKNTKNNSDKDRRSKSIQRLRKGSSLSNEEYEEDVEDDISSCSSHQSSATSLDEQQQKHNIDNTCNSNNLNYSENEQQQQHQQHLPSHLQEELENTDFTLVDNVSWDISKSDMFIEVDETLFPVKKNFLVYISEKFQTLIYGSASMQVGDSVFLSLSNQYSVHEIRTVLSYMHSSDDAQLTDQNVAFLLQLGDEFKISRLVYQCERHLRNSDTFNPLITCHLARQYRLNALLDHAYCEISKIDGVEESQEFQLMDAVAQNQILKYLVKRHRKAARTLNQFDVHLCQHHGSDPKNNACCFRAATYSTEKDRIFLVRMEKPEEKMVERFRTVLNCDSENLISEQNSCNDYRAHNGTCSSSGVMKGHQTVSKTTSLSGKFYSV